MKTPTLITPNLTVRPIEPTDQEMVFKGFSHPEVTKYMDITYGTYEATNEQMLWYKTNTESGTGHYWALINQQQQFVGVFSMYHINTNYRKAEIGYWMFPEFWGKGFGAEAITAIVSFAQNELNLHRIAAEIEPENVGSWKLLKKLGFELEGTFRDYEYRNGKYNDLQVWAKLL